MTGQGISQILFYSVALVALGYPLGLWMARVYNLPRVGGRLLARGGERLLQGRSHRPDPRAGLEELRQDRARLQRALLGAALSDPARAGAPVPQPGSHEGRAGASVAEHGGQLHHEHELAVLRRRVHDVVPDPDGRTGRPELRLGCGRDRGSRSSRPRDLEALLRHDRQLLGRSLPHARLPASAAVHCRHRAVDLAGRSADLPRPCNRNDPPGRAPDDRARAGGLADRDEAAGDERRGLLQLELGGPVREPDGPLQLHRAAGDPADPGGPGVHVREDGVRSPARMGGVRRHVRRLRDRYRRQPARRAARLVGAAQLGREHHAGQRPVRRQHVGQGGALRSSELLALDGRHQ